MNIGNRLKEERTRLGYSQEEFAEVASITRRPYAEWESGRTSPTAAQLAALASIGLDVLYVVLGQRSQPSGPVLDAAEQVLLDSYRRCKPEARTNLIQTAALLSAGLDASAPKRTTRSPNSVQVGSQISTHDGSVQIGYAGGKVRVGKK